MILTIIAIILIAPLFVIGVLYLFSHKWLPKLAMTISSTPPQSPAVFKLAAWKFRALGVFYILVSLLPFIPMIVPAADYFFPYIIAIAAMSWISSFILGWVALSIKNKKAD